MIGPDVATLGEMRNAYSILVELETVHLQDLGTDGKIMLPYIDLLKAQYYTKPEVHKSRT